ncbi:HEPN domain-containing protein [Moritella sp. F3]|uniref:HEPN domain-containing protein n=1 Tax=Moritella sp. F3 TaxID=2718882 RepID=UPI0018E13307|nr:HEPN domain-containing protein [Moritella sp. F3]GIC75347.1 hypothetical protein FMO001_00740 [Moritella sp. F1]GIC80492.1 hypothetical protein FMO003_07730 [Moritella sp. F3]
MNKLDKVLKISDLIEAGSLNLQINEQPFKSFGLPNKRLNVVGHNNLLEFEELVNSLYEEEKDIFNSFSHKVFVKKLIATIGEAKFADEKITDEKVKALFRDLKATPLVDFSVYREIFGIAMNQNQKLTFGNFEISHISLAKEHDFKESDHDFMFFGKEPEYLIKYNVNARDRDRAKEIADEAFQKFTLFLRYIIGTSNRKFEVGILHFSGSKVRKAYISSSDGQLNVESSRYGYVEPIPLDNNYFSNSEVGYDKVWQLIDKRQSKLEQRLATAIEWLGRSLQEDAIQAAFIEASIALESIFTYSEKSIVSPSILSQISESTALLLGSDLSSRLEIEKHIKKLYSIRSGIVHAGSKDVSEESYAIFVSYIRNVITKLLVSEPYCSCNTVESMYEELKKIKYSA